MAKRKNKVIKSSMISVRSDQYERILKIVEKEDRTIRSVIERLLDTYEGKKKEC